MTTLSGRPLTHMSGPELKRWFDSGHSSLDGPCHFEMELLTEIDFRRKDLTGCDFVGAIFRQGQDFSEAILENCTFGPARPQLERIYFVRANFENAVLRGANLIGVSFIDCNFRNADLTNADLSKCSFMRSDFSYAMMFGATLSEANLFQAVFYRTRLSLKRGIVLQTSFELWSSWCQSHRYPLTTEVERFEQAASIYLEIKENLRTIGAYSEASWAYVQERRMRRKQRNPFYVWKDYRRSRTRTNSVEAHVDLYGWLYWMVDIAVDTTTGYGESIAKTFVTLFLSVALVFPCLYYLSGGVNIETTFRSPDVTRDYWHLLSFSIGNLLQNQPNVEAATDIGHVLKVVQQFFSVMMIGLLGFVLGNKINQK